MKIYLYAFLFFLLPFSTHAFDVKKAESQAQKLVDDTELYDQLKRKAGLVAGMRVPGIMGWLSKNSFDILDSLDHANDVTAGLSPSGFVASIMQESMINILLCADAICEYGYDPLFDDLSTSSDGMDDGIFIQDKLKREGYLRQDYTGLQPELTQDGSPIKVRNEANDEYVLGAFESLDAYTEFFAARYQYSHDKFVEAAKALHIQLPNDNPLIAAWSYIFYNAGSGGGKRLLQNNGINVLKGDGKNIFDVDTKNTSSRNAFKNAKRVYALATLLEIADILPAVNPHDPKTID
ncbi:MAG: hypothetical protein KDD46_00150 [Bdellovibrionales bacterium]|nr:hypothetical protein [Bdellovibrionales bacterium]